MPHGAKVGDELTPSIGTLLTLKDGDPAARPDDLVIGGKSRDVCTSEVGGKSPVACDADTGTLALVGGRP